MADERPSKCAIIQSEEIDCDLVSRELIYKFLVNNQDEIRCAYLIVSPYQPLKI